jgi:hypothetical protein
MFLGYNYRIMLKWLAIVAMFLAIAQAPVPVTGQASDHPTNASNDIQSDSNANKKPPAPPPVIQPIQPTKEQYDGSTEAGKNNPQPITIRELPSVSVTKDWADKSYWLFSGLLVVVGGFQMFLLWRTLAAIKRQAELMKQSADISRGATVPTLRILNFGMGGSDPLVDHEMELTVRNYGATPAILDALHISFDDGERWPTGEGESVSYSDPGGRAVAANSEVVIQSSPYICLVSPDLIHRFRREQRSIYAHVRLKYLDVFDSPTRSLRFSVHLNQRQNGTIRCDITGQWNEYDKPQKAN